MSRALFAIVAALDTHHRRTTMPTTPCRCGQPKGPGRYVCSRCWNGLTIPTRRALNRRDSNAVSRLRELHQQMDAGTPLSQIEITP